MNFHSKEVQKKVEWIMKQPLHMRRAELRKGIEAMSRMPADLRKRSTILQEDYDQLVRLLHQVNEFIEVREGKKDV